MHSLCHKDFFPSNIYPVMELLSGNMKTVMIEVLLRGQNLQVESQQWSKKKEDTRSVVMCLPDHLCKERTENQVKHS